jgi:uncharacterized protein YdeI (YjbR/CyaY-like superfamily)
MPDPIFFESPQVFRRWLAKNHATETELWIGYYKKASGIPSLTWAEAVDEALCYGWIDGLVRRIDEKSHMQRFTPRKKTSKWSTRNIERVADLTARGLMRAAGKKAFEARREDRSGVYSYEQRDQATFDPAQSKKFRSKKTAWTFFQAQPMWYRRAATWWVVSAKRADTRERRLTQLIEDSANKRTVPPLTRPPKR